MNDPDYGELLVALFFFSIALYHAFAWRLFRRMLRWQTPPDDYPASSLTRWLAVATCFVMALRNAAQGIGFPDLSSSMRRGYLAFLLAMFVAIHVADRCDRRRSRAQSKGD